MKESKKSFNIVRFLSATTIFGVLNTSFICMVIVPFFKDSGLLPLQLSIVLLAKKVIRLFSDSFFGLLFDKYGAKFVFFIGRISKLISFIMLGFYKPSFVVFIVAMIFDGLSYSAIYGKIGTFIYNTLSANNKINFYSRAISIYYFVADVFIASMSFTASVLVKMYGYNTLIYIAIIMNIISIFILLIFISNEKKTKDHNYYQFFNKKSLSFKEIIKSFIEISKNNKVFLYLLVFYGIVNFISWQFGSIISLILLDTGYDASQLAFVGAIYKIITSIGCLLPIIIFRNGLKIKTCLMLFLFLLFLGFASAIIYKSFIIVAFMCVIIFFYTTIEVSIEKTIDKIADLKIRGTAISMAMTFCNIFTILGLFLTGFIAQYFSYQLSMIIILLIVFFVIFFILFQITNKIENNICSF